MNEYTARISALETENARLKAELAQAVGGVSQLQPGLRSTAAGPDVLFSAVEMTRMPMILTDPNKPDDPIIFANRAFQELCGYSSEELIGQNCRFLQGEDTDRQKVDMIRQALTEDRDVAIEIINYRRDGTPFVNDLYISPVYDQQGKLLYRFGSQLDITKYRQSDEALIRSETRYATLFRAIDQGFCIIEFFDGSHGPLSDYTHIEANPGYQRQTGIAGIVGKTLREIAPDDADEWIRLYGSVLQTGTPIYFEREFSQVNRIIEVSAHRIEPASLRQVAVLFADITLRKRAEQMMREENIDLGQQVTIRTAERNRLWETTTDLMGTATLDGRLVAVNPAWTRLLGWSHSQLLAQPFLDIVHPDDHVATGVVVQRLRRGESVTGFVDRVLTEDGGERAVMWTATPDTDPGSELFYIIGRDMTDQFRSEEQLRQSQKMEAVGQLTGGLAHDFNNLLAGIVGSLELLNMRMSQGRLREVEKYIVAAQGAAKRAAALTHRLLAFSRQQTLQPKAINVNNLAKGMLDLIQRTVGPGIDVELVGQTGLWPALVDPSQLENALLNLCINARDAMPEGGKITIETGNRWIDWEGAKRQDIPEGQYLSLCVSDTGTGMPPEVIAKAFDPFFTTKPIGQGTGLGLSMIYGFAKQSGGQARIYSEMGQGTMVCLYLPRHRGKAEKDDEAAIAALAPVAGAGETVLVVDDEPTVRMLVTDVLEDLGYTAIEAADSAGGLCVLQSDARIDLLVTDVGLPGGMNGRQMVDAARATRPDLKVLFITGFAENALLNNGQLEPGMSVLTKPFAVDTLAARIRELITK